MTYGFATHEHAEQWLEVGGETREEAAANVFLHEVGPACDEIFICERKEMDHVQIFCEANDAEGMIERAEDHAADECPWHEDAFFEYTSEDLKAFNLAFQQMVQQWFAVRTMPDVWEAVNITRHTRPESAS